MPGFREPEVDAQTVERLVSEFGLEAGAVGRTLALLDDRCTAPFIGRYRQEVTGGLTEDQVRALDGRARELLSAEKRKATTLRQLESHGVLTDELRARVASADSRGALEDITLPYRPRRRTRGALACERGLEPLALEFAAQQPDAPAPEERAAALVNADAGLPDAAAVLDGARHILAEWIAERPESRSQLRQLVAETGVVRSKVAAGKEGQHSKYEMYYDFSEPVAKIRSHRVLALRRGEKDHWLTVRVEVDREQALAILRETTLRTPESPVVPVLEAAMADAWDRLLLPALEADTRTDLKRRADVEAIQVFAQNVCNLLLESPAGPRRTLGVAPGYRTGCKLAVVDETGSLAAHAVIHPHPPQAEAEKAGTAARELIEKYDIEAIAIGSGTASRETDRFFHALLHELPDRKIVCMVVQESVAITYGGAKVGREELPGVEPAIRTAVSLARRLQDPLYELAKVDAKTIGVGQYQHDVNQQVLRHALEATVEGAATSVGVDLNRASALLLSALPGIDPAGAREIVAYRKLHGPFRTLAPLLDVPRMDAKRFEQAAGFLRIPDGDEPLDRTAIHPERYELAARIAADAGTDVAALLGDTARIEAVDFARYADESVGEPTLALLRRELLQPGRDPRPPFRSVEFRDDLITVDQLETGMILEGKVTNVTNFGAFVDIGIQEDGLVHVSELARHYVKDANEAVHVGNIVRVKVISVDTERRRIGLSIKQALPRRKPKPKPK
ncbi:RNA-binding transcriptional accessory protein, partial [bacterium]|nr:RNA-binding transcriptional accessory protein [bacterium]